MDLKEITTDVRCVTGNNKYGDELNTSMKVCVNNIIIRTITYWGTYLVRKRITSKHCVRG